MPKNEAYGENSMYDIELLYKEIFFIILKLVVFRIIIFDFVSIEASNLSSEEIDMLTTVETWERRVLISLKFYLTMFFFSSIFQILTEQSADELAIC